MFRAALAAALLLPGVMSCFEPSLPEGLTCSPSAACPPAQFCEPNTHVCYAEGTTDVGAPTAIEFSQQPSRVTVNHAMPGVYVRIADQRGRPVLTSTASITLALETPDGAVLSGTLTRAAVEGEVTFDDLVVDTRGSYRLVASVAGLPDRTSAPIEISSVSFVEPVQFAAGVEPLDAAIGDFDGDAKLDVLTADQEGLFNFLRGDGTGALGAPVMSSSGMSASAIVVADLNQDGKLDAVIGGMAGPVVQVVVFVGNGDGTFEVVAPFPATGSLDGLAVADLDDDNKVDLLVPTHDPGGVRIYWNDTPAPGATPAFGLVELPCVGPQPDDVAVGRFDDDMLPDIITSGEGGACAMRHDPASATSRTFLPAQSADKGFRSYRSLAIGEFTGDGAFDLVVGDTQIPTIDIIQAGASPGSLAAPTPFRVVSSRHYLATSDLDRDGHDDLLLVNDNDSLLLLMQEQPGMFTELPVPLPQGARDTEVADLTGDGLLDIVVLHGSQLSVLVGQ